MVKADELSDPNSCLNKAKDGELIFVLLARDICAPGAIRAWASLRVAFGKNEENDEQIRTARELALQMEKQLIV